MAVDFVNLYDFKDGCPTTSPSFAAYSLQVTGASNTGYCSVSGALTVHTWHLTMQQPNPPKA